MKKCGSLLFLSLLILSSCQKYYLTVYQERVDRDSLASTHVGSPDPRQKNPPKGQELIIEWQIPEDILRQKPSIHLEMIYKDYSEDKKVYLISHKSGYVVYKLVDEEYKKTKGLLAYKVEIKTEDGQIFRVWQHQMWVNIIRLEEPKEEESTSEPVDEFYQPETDEEESATFFPPES
jgi:hypothetical protein